MASSPSLSSPASGGGSGWGLAELEALDLSRRGLWQVVDKCVPARAFEGREQTLYVCLQRPHELLVCTNSGFDDHKRLWFDEIVLVRGADHSCLQHMLVRDERRLDLGRRHVHPAYLHHVVAAPAIN